MLYTSRIYKKLIEQRFFTKHLSKKSLYAYIFKKSWNISYHHTNYKYSIYKGNRFNKLTMSSWLVRTKFGNYSITRKPFVFIKKKKR